MVQIIIIYKLTLIYKLYIYIKKIKMILMFYVISA